MKTQAGVVRWVWKDLWVGISSVGGEYQIVNEAGDARFRVWRARVAADGLTRWDDLGTASVLKVAKRMAEEDAASGATANQ